MSVLKNQGLSKDQLNSNRWQQIRWCTVSGIAGGAIVLICQGWTLQLKPLGMTFEAFAGILLAAVAVLVAALGVVAAIFAIWGFGLIREEAQKKSKEIAELIAGETSKTETSSLIETAMASGGLLRTHMENIIIEYLESPALLALIEERREIAKPSIDAEWGTTDVPAMPASQMPAASTAPADNSTQEKKTGGK